MPIVVILLLLLHASTHVYATDVVINEFLADLPAGQEEAQDEWIELYNNDDSPISLLGWTLKDSNDAHTLRIGEITIPAHGFSVITRKGSSFSLNNDADTIRLYDSTSAAVLVDTFTYEGTTESRSWGRIPDGTGSFVANLIPSSGSANIAPPSPTPVPTPTPTPSTSSGPTATLSLLPTPTPTPTPYPSPTTTSSPAPTPKPAASASPSAFFVPFSTVSGELATRATPAAILGVTSDTDAASPYVPILFIGGGLLLVVGAVPLGLSLFKET